MLLFLQDVLRDVSTVHPFLSRDIYWCIDDGFVFLACYQYAQMLVYELSFTRFEPIGFWSAHEKSGKYNIS